MEDQADVLGMQVWGTDVLEYWDWGLGCYPLKDTVAVMVSKIWADVMSGRLGRCVECTG